MMAGKYDTTPEGRREANALALELELMNPAPAKPPRDFFGRTVALVRRLRDSRRERHGHQELRGVKEVPQPAAVIVASQAPPTTAPVPLSVASAPPTPSVAAFEAAAKAAIPAASASRTPSDANVREDNFVAPPCPESRRASRRPPEKVYEQPSDQYPKTCRKQEMPVPGTTLARTGHTTAWYAPASGRDVSPTRFPAVKRSSGARFARRATVASSTKCRTVHSGASPCNSPRMNTCTKHPGGCFAANVMDIRSFAALKKSSGAFARE